MVQIWCDLACDLACDLDLSAFGMSGSCLRRHAVDPSRHGSGRRLKAGWFWHVCLLTPICGNGHWIAIPMITMALLSAAYFEDRVTHLR